MNQVYLSKPRKAFYILSWIPVAAVHIVLILLGLVAVPFALHLCDYEPGIPRKDMWPDFFWIWGNDEEEVPRWWYNKAAQNWLTRLFPNFWWYAIRNPVNNFRFIFKDRAANWSGNWVSDVMEPTELIENGVGEAHRWKYNGMFAGYRKVWLNGDGKYSEIWVGWKIGSGVPGMGFTTQVRLNRQIGE